MLAAFVIACGAAFAGTIVAIPVYRLTELFADVDFRIAVMAMPKYLRDNDAAELAP